MSAVDEEKLLETVCKNMPELQLVAARLVKKGLEDDLRQQTAAFATQRADAAWKRRDKGPPKEAAVTPPEVSEIEVEGTCFSRLTCWQLSKNLASGRSLPPAVLSHFVTKLHPVSLTVFSDHLKELQSQGAASAISTFLDKFALRFVVYLQGVQGLNDKTLRSKLGDDLLTYASETGLAALDKLEAAFLDQVDANLQRLHSLRSCLKDSTKPKDVVKRLQQIQTEIWDFVQDLDGKAPDEVMIALKKNQLVEEMNAKCQHAKDLSLQVLLTLLVVHAKSRPGALKASG